MDSKVSAFSLSNVLSSVSEESNEGSSSVKNYPAYTIPVESSGELSYLEETSEEYPHRGETPGVYPHVGKTLGKFSSMVSFTHHNANDLIRGDIMRRKTLPPRMKIFGIKDIQFIILWILCGWLPMALDWSLFFIRDYNNSMPVSKSKTEKSLAFNTADSEGAKEGNYTFRPSNGSTPIRPKIKRKKRPAAAPTSFLPTTAPTPFEYIFSHGDQQDVIYTWTKLCSKALLFSPLASTISLYIYTNLSKFSGRKLVSRLAIIYLSQIIISAPFITLRLLYRTNLNIFIAGTISFHLVILVGWWLLAKALSMEWEISMKWLPVLQVCKATVFFLSGLPLVISCGAVAASAPYVPMILLIIEFIFTKILHKMFCGYFENVLGLFYTMAYIVYPMELMRFMSFACVWIQFMKQDAPVRFLVTNVSFCILGEIWTHTHIWLLCNNELAIRRYGKRLNNFTEIKEYYSSIRSCLEYVCPMFYAFNILFANMCRYHVPQMDAGWNYVIFHSSKKLIKNTWKILGAYYLMELTAELICWVIVRLCSYERLSAIGELKWTFLLVLMLYVGTEVDVPLNTAGFLRVLLVSNQ